MAQNNRFKPITLKNMDIMGRLHPDKPVRGGDSAAFNPGKRLVTDPGNRETGATGRSGKRSSDRYNLGTEDFRRLQVIRYKLLASTDFRFSPAKTEPLCACTPM